MSYCKSYTYNVQFDKVSISRPVWDSLCLELKEVGPACPLLLPPRHRDLQIQTQQQCGSNHRKCLQPAKQQSINTRCIDLQIQTQQQCRSNHKECKQPANQLSVTTKCRDIQIQTQEWCGSNHRNVQNLLMQKSISTRC